MKLMIAIIQPSKLDAVREALEKIEITRMTICDAQGIGRPSEHIGPQSDRGSPPALLRKIALEVVVNDDFLDRAIQAITNVARTGPEGAIGDGKIFIVPAAEAIQVNDGRRGLGAV